MMPKITSLLSLLKNSSWVCGKHLCQYLSHSAHSDLQEMTIILKSLIIKIAFFLYLPWFPINLHRWSLMELSSALPFFLKKKIKIWLTATAKLQMRLRPCWLRFWVILLTASLFPRLWDCLDWISIFKTNNALIMRKSHVSLLYHNQALTCSHRLQL